MTPEQTDTTITMTHTIEDIHKVHALLMQQGLHGIASEVRKALESMKAASQWYNTTVLKEEGE